MISNRRIYNGTSSPDLQFRRYFYKPPQMQQIQVSSHSTSVCLKFSTPSKLQTVHRSSLLPVGKLQSRRNRSSKPTSRSVLSVADRGSPPTNTSVPLAVRRSAHSRTQHTKTAVNGIEISASIHQKQNDIPR